ncbi:MAG: hypothetical protein O3C21_06005 [Verrucomicrobia bacterium]|nr:hypothetical protein [Verrucomicrobiota bacterium]
MFQITEVAHAPGQPVRIVFTWNSRSNATYAVYRSSDLSTWEELTDGLASGGETTTFSADLPNGSSSAYVRVREEQ